MGAASAARVRRAGARRDGNVRALPRGMGREPARRPSLQLRGARRGQHGGPACEFGSRASRRYLIPLAAGEIRQRFSMTEPATCRNSNHLLSGRPRPWDGTDYVINGRKWFTSSCDGARFAIVMAVTNPEAQSHAPREPDTIVPADAPGIQVEPVPTLGHRGRGWTTHCEVAVRRCTSPSQSSSSRVLGVRASAPARPGFRASRKTIHVVRAPARVASGSVRPSRSEGIGTGERLVTVDHPVVAVEHVVRRSVGSAPETSGWSSRRTTGCRPRRAASASAPSRSSPPNRWRISPLPASGAWQLKTYCAHGHAPDLLVQMGVGEETTARFRPLPAGGAVPTAPPPSPARAAPRSAPAQRRPRVRAPPRSDTRAPPRRRGTRRAAPRSRGTEWDAARARIRANAALINRDEAILAGLLGIERVSDA